MKFKKIIKSALIVLVIFGLGFAAAGLKEKIFNSTGDNVLHEDHEHDEKTLYTCSMHPFIVEDKPGECPICGMDLVEKEQKEESGEKKRVIAYWKAPMNPSEIYDSPGKSAMGMDLVPVYEDELSGGVDIKIDPVVVQNMGIKTAKVKEEDLSYTIRTYGHITYDETRIVEVNPRFSGWVEEIYVNFNGESVKKADPLFRVYSPELIRAQEEYISALRNRSISGSSIGESAKRRLLNYGLSKAFIEKLKINKKAEDSILIRAMASGIIQDKNILNGGFFSSGKSLMKIMDISSVWVEGHIFDREIDMVKKGMDVEMILPFKPGEKFMGKVTFIYPYIEKKTRDVIVRIEFENKDMELKPDMYADIIINTNKGRGLVVPDESIIRSGIKNIIFVAKANGKFIPRDVKLGSPVNGSKIHIVTGLAPGEEVVVSGQFMLDSESRLNEAVNKMLTAEKKEDAVDKKAEDDFFSDM
jgi:Cu(I)/Ag(I) efflux system membrane fusion protein/cobalt-zinc-cadmium efflux system membrane fusion protein